MFSFWRSAEEAVAHRSEYLLIHSASAHSAGPFCYGMSVVGLSARLVVTL